MKFIVGVTALLWVSWSGPAQSQSVTVVKFDQLKQLLDRSGDTLYVVNFWATWCAPCVKELPYFETARREYANRNVRVLLVSMDDPESLAKKVVPFVRTRKIQSRVLLLDEPDANVWIDKIAPEWSGGLPMTLILNTKKGIRRFIGKPVDEGELKSIINQFI